MIVFTILGYWVFLCGMYSLGWHIGLMLDLRRGIVKLNTATDETFKHIESFVMLLAKGKPQ